MDVEFMKRVAARMETSDPDAWGPLASGRRSSNRDAPHDGLGQLRLIENKAIAFSSEVDTGSREENASKQQSRTSDVAPLA
jgi:hypothetical protein